ncbi:acyltransferase family protein [Sphingomonas sp. RS6]
MESKAVRYIYLDNIRVLAMLLGVFVHAANLGDFGPLELVTPISDAFRMALFFAVSGFLGAMLLQKRGSRRFLKDRLRNVLVPLICGLFLLNPITWVLAYVYAYGTLNVHDLIDAVLQSRDVNSHIFVWHIHLWFLISLAVYVLIAPILVPVVHRHRHALDRLAVSPLLASASLVGAIVIASLAWKVIATVLAKLVGDVPWIVEVTARYLPFYAMGILLYEAEAMRRAAVRPNLLIGLIVLGAYAGLASLTLPDIVTKAGWLAVLPAVRCWATLAIMWCGLRFLDRASKAMDTLRSSIYTAYLFQYLLIYIAANAVGGLRDQPVIFYTLLVSWAVISGVGLHVFVIARSNTLLYLFNGRLRPQTASADNQQLNADSAARL